MDTLLIPSTDYTLDVIEDRKYSAKLNSRNVTIISEFTTSTSDAQRFRQRLERFSSNSCDYGCATLSVLSTMHHKSSSIIL